MNKWEKELAKLELQGEREVLEEMRRHYAEALSRVNARIDELADRDDLSGIRQRNYQMALAEQIGSIMDDLGSGCYATLGEYLEQCYEQGFVGALYNLQKQGIPLAFPIDQKSMARAVTMTANDVKLSKRIYGDVGKLQKQVISEITRGLATGAHAAQVAGNIAEKTDIADSIKKKVQGRGSQAFRRSMTIARTEKGRVKATSALEAMYKAKAEGADIVKQWDSTMDSRTRPDHVKADGQIREIDEDFDVGGHHGPSPHLMGAAAQDINCRCVCLQRARSALERDEPSQKWDGVNQCYVDISDAGSYGEFKTRWQIKNAEADIDRLMKSVARYAKQASALESMSYSGIWRDDVTVKDYAAKKAAIPKKLDYFNDHLSEDEPKFRALIALLDDFERDGRKYERISAKRRQAQSDLRARQRDLARLKGEDVIDDPFSDERKAAALSFSKRKDADKHYRPWLDAEWNGLSDYQKYSVWQYTHNSHPMNKALSGYEETWARKDFKGVGNAKWGHEDKYRSLGSAFAPRFAKAGTRNSVDYRKTIAELTTAIDRFGLQDDVYLFRKSGSEGFAGLLEGALISFDDALQLLNGNRIADLKARVVGQYFENHAFTSTGMAKDFSWSGNVSYTIYAPKGTKGVYAEPQSYYGQTVGPRERIYSVGDSYTDVGTEAEIILQRGTAFRITDISGTSSSLHVEMEVVDQPGYFSTGYEETFNGGATVHHD